MKVVSGPDADITNNDVSLTAWSNMSFMAVAMALAEHGDEVILPVPWYTSQVVAFAKYWYPDRYFNHQ
ncbi:hypothetical protein JB92DRAFT_2993610 [Gautieria morchelliformis]|nr:hypothetical protein JB92DRAFT_2993610 [Gautieria morchelliformis]